MPGLAALLVWEAVRHWPRVRVVAVISGATRPDARLCSTWASARTGNVQRWVDWTTRRQQLEELAAAMPGTAVVSIDTPDMDPSHEFFMGRTFLNRQISMPGTNGHPAYRSADLLNKGGSASFRQTFRHTACLCTGERQSSPCSSLKSKPGLLNQTLSISSDQTLLNSWGRGIWGYAYHPPAGGLVGTPSSADHPPPRRRGLRRDFSL